jgi:hypothetical protein
LRLEDLRGPEREPEREPEQEPGVGRGVEIHFLQLAHYHQLDHCHFLEKIKHPSIVVPPFYRQFEASDLILRSEVAVLTGHRKEDFHRVGSDGDHDHADGVGIYHHYCLIILAY